MPRLGRPVDRHFVNIWGSLRDADAQLAGQTYQYSGGYPLSLLDPLLQAYMGYLADLSLRATRSIHDGSSCTC